MILLTGGAGYIGSQLAYQLHQEGEDFIVVDNLSTGVAKSIEGDNLLVGDIGDASLLDDLFSRYAITEVIHLAASTVVSESVSNPAKFYLNNSVNTTQLLAKCVEYGVKHFIFSSTAAVYGVPDRFPVDEETPCEPINPYGRSKQISEMVLKDIANASAMRYVTLRYFNVAGADPKGQLGPHNPESTLLIRYAVQTSLGLHDHLTVYGNDYATQDGTGVRDYIHVADIAQAHINALHYLRVGNESFTANCGYGHGYSVLDVIKAVEQVTGQSLAVQYADRRPGDPAQVVADSRKIQEALAWYPKYDNLEKIVADAYHWEKHLSQS